MGVRGSAQPPTRMIVLILTIALLLLITVSGADLGGKPSVVDRQELKWDGRWRFNGESQYLLVNSFSPGSERNACVHRASLMI